MPELPEVEAVCKSLSQKVAAGSSLDECQFARQELRFAIPIEQIKSLVGCKLSRFERRGKYLLFVFSEGILISHLGMTGHWRVEHRSEEEAVVRKHDHVKLIFSNVVMIYNDPRRFGYLQFARNQKELSKLPLFRNLGVEPLLKDFNADYLTQLARDSERAVKVFLMDQGVVVGIGNIYASEILFRAKVHPERKVRKVTPKEWQRIVESTQIILHAAIDSGGSSIRDYRSVDGIEGKAQHLHKVYGRIGEACLACGTAIRGKTLGGRATYWCSKCQKA